MQVDLLISKLKCPSLYRGRAAYKYFKLHAQYAGIEINTLGFS